MSQEWSVAVLRLKCGFLLQNCVLQVTMMLLLKWSLELSPSPTFTGQPSPRGLLVNLSPPVSGPQAQALTTAANHWVEKRLPRFQGFLPQGSPASGSQAGTSLLGTRLHSRRWGASGQAKLHRIHNHSPSLTLRPKLHLLSDQQRP